MNRPSPLRFRSPVSITVIAAAVCLGVIFLLGVSCIAAAFGWSQGLSSLSMLSGLDSAGWVLRLLAGGIGALLISTGLLAGWGPRASEQQSEEVVQRTERGEVRISSEAIVDYLERESVRVAGVDSVRIRFERGAVGWTLRVEAILTNEAPLPILEERLQSVLENELKETLGVREVEGIHLAVKRVLPDTRPLLLASPKRSERGAVALVSNQGDQRRPGQS
ncbi:MAG: hypothetical protein GHCLOJNM_01352 [bacterium]|nr:hypothetical protein [bacterium]